MTAAAPAVATSTKATLPILFALSTGHLINDLVQSLLPSVYPLLKQELGLTFFEVGLITFVFQGTASLLQPMIGTFTDRRPMPMSLFVGMLCSLTGLLLLSRAHDFWLVLMAASIIGIGSSIFHPEASRVARAAAGNAFGFAQSIFQVGGNAGQAIGPLVVALFVLPFGQSAIGWVGVLAVAGALMLLRVGRWYAGHLVARKVSTPAPQPLGRTVVIALTLLLVLVFSKNFYMSGMQTFFAFALIEKFGISVRDSQLYLFVFMAAAAIGVMAGGPLADRFGRRNILWLSVAGMLPFSVALVYAPSLALTVVLAFLAALLMALPSSAIIVEATSYAPGRVGLIGGLFFGFAFGAGGLGAAVLGWLAQLTSLNTIFVSMAFLPALGFAIFFLPRPDAASSH